MTKPCGVSCPVATTPLPGMSEVAVPGCWPRVGFPQKRGSQAPATFQGCSAETQPCQPHQPPRAWAALACCNCPVERDWLHSRASPTGPQGTVRAPCSVGPVPPRRRQHGSRSPWRGDPRTEVGQDRPRQYRAYHRPLRIAAQATGKRRAPGTLCALGPADTAHSGKHDCLAGPI